MSNNLELALKIRALVEGLANVEQLSGEVRELADQAGKELPDPTDELRDGMNKTKDLAGQLQAELARLLTAAALGKFVKDSVQAVRTAEASFRGLEAVAEHTGVGIGRAFQEAQKLSADGLMTVSDASKALQNLLSRGYDVEQAVATLERLKDSAAFNRAAHLSMSEAVLTATEGLKNENSILVDNAGVTKNVAKMWEEYAKSIGKSATNLTQAEKIQAEFNGILKETEAQAGNAQKALGGIEGQAASLNKNINELETAFGVALIPALTELAKAGKFVINDFVKPFLGGLEILSIKIAAAVENMGALWDGVKIGGDGAAAAFERIKRNMEVADQMAADVVDRYEGGLIPAAQQAAAAAKAYGDASQAAGDQATAATDTAAEAAANLVAQLNAAGTAGTGAGKAINDAMATIDLTSADGVRALALAYAQAGDKARELDAAAAKTIADMNAADLTAFSGTLTAAFASGQAGAEQLTHINDLVLAESFKRLGLTAEVELGRINPKAQEAIAAVDAIRLSVEQTGISGEQRMQALGNALAQAIGSADTLAAAEAIRERIEAMGKTGELAGKKLELAMKAAKGRVEDLTPGIQSVDEAMKELGITSQAALMETAERARDAYQVIKSGGTTLEDQKQAWLKWAQAAIASGDEAAIAMVKAEGAILGYGKEVDRLVGQQGVVGDATKDAAAALAEQARQAEDARRKLRELAGQADDTAGSQRDLADATREAAGAGGERGAQAINYEALSEKELEKERQRLNAQIAQSYNTPAFYGLGAGKHFREQFERELDRVDKAAAKLAAEREREVGASRPSGQQPTSVGTVNVNFRLPAGGVKTVRVAAGDENNLLEALRDSQLIS